MPVMRLRICSMASNSSVCVGGCPLMVLPRFLIALTMQSALTIVEVGRVWSRKVNLSARWAAPASVITLMH